MKGDGMRAKCPYFKARVDVHGHFCISCDAPHALRGAVLYKGRLLRFDRILGKETPRLSGYVFETWVTRNLFYRVKCCAMDHCWMRKQYEREEAGNDEL